LAHTLSTVSAAFKVFPADKVISRKIAEGCVGPIYGGEFTISIETPSILVTFITEWSLRKMTATLGIATAAARLNCGDVESEASVVVGMTMNNQSFQ